MAAAVLAVGILLILIQYVFATFSYSMSDGSLVMRWHILGGVPFGSRTINIVDIREARRFRPASDLLGGYIFGNIPGRPIVTLVLGKRIYLMKRVFITPSDPAAFLAELRRRMPRAE